MLMSSSISVQRIPEPDAKISQRDRSSLDEFSKRGYQETGMEIVRPSRSSTTRLSSSNDTAAAAGRDMSSAEELIPRLNNHCLMRFDNTPYFSKFRGAEPASVIQLGRADPVLGDRTISVHVDMNWLVAIAGVEEEPIWPNVQNRRHGRALALWSQRTWCTARHARMLVSHTVRERLENYAASTSSPEIALGSWVVMIERPPLSSGDRTSTR